MVDAWGNIAGHSEVGVLSHKSDQSVCACVSV
jgi:hypothetical protein